MYDYQFVDAFIEDAKTIAESNSKEEAFNIIKEQLDQLENRYLNECLGVLNYIHSEKCLDWIEENISRTENISLSWGYLAAMSDFNWLRAEKWIDLGRPLSLIALDGIYFCTSKGKKLNQSPMMREINPKLTDNPNLEIVAEKMSEYALKDNKLRVKNTVDAIIKNLFN